MGKNVSAAFIIPKSPWFPMNFEVLEIQTSDRFYKQMEELVKIREWTNSILYSSQLLI